MVASRVVGPRGQVHAFEPNPNVGETLQANAAANVTVHTKALAERSGRMELFHTHGRESHYSLGGEAGESSEEIETTTLDEFCGDDIRPDCIKLDVEGAEELVLRGGEKALGARPTIIFEVNASAAERLELSPSGCWDLLAELDYDFFTVDHGELHPLPLAPWAGNVVAVSNIPRPR